MEDVKIANSEYIRDLNLASIFRLIHKYGPVSRKELSDNTGYSPATISNHVKRLLDNGFVKETDKGSSTGGRKPVYLTVNPERGYLLAMDIGVNYVKIYLFDLNLQIKDQLEIAGRKKRAEELMPFLVKSLKEFCRKAGIDTDKIIGLGVALPGLVDNEKGYLHFAPNLKWHNLDIRSYFAEEFAFSILIENEAKAAVIGEKEVIYPGIDNIAFVSINEGVGCGLIIDGKLYLGASGNAGEFGHIIIDSDGPECHCGNSGCWETLASMNFIINKYFERTGEKLDSQEIIKKVSFQPDQELLSIVKECAHNIAVGLVNIINSLSPELLVIGGDIIGLKKYIAEDIERIVKKNALNISYEKANIVYSKLGNKAALYGLARMVFDNSIGREIIKDYI
jgi:predicted NBD/HSP70 family sugar kinase